MALRADIATPQRTRGRPKGTGIDDRDRVVQLKQLLSADKTLKPTTAIKRLGISDPSVIRRLRDKLAEPTSGSSIADPMVQQPVSQSNIKIIRTEKKAQQPRSKGPLVSVPTAEPPPVRPTATPVQEPTAASTAAAEQKARDAALLAAYLQAMQQSQSKPLPDPVVSKPAQPSIETPRPDLKPAPKPEPPKAPQAPFSFANPFASMMPPMPAMGFPGMPSAPGIPQNPMQAFSIPGFPSFLQPFQQKQTAPEPGTSQARQLEALKLAIEATTAIARFQLHLVENSAAYSPMAMMLQGQSFIGQMMIAGLTGQLDAMRRQMMGQAATPPAGGEKK